MIRLGDLVRTADGYYGIVTDPLAKLVFLANGCEQKMDENDWRGLKQLPLTEANGVTSPANFAELLREKREAGPHHC